MSQFQNPLTALQQDATPTSPDLSAPPEVAVGRPTPQGEMPVWDTTDALLAAPRGVVGAAQGIYNTIDWIGFDVLPDWKTNPLGESRSIVGGLLEGLVEFSTVLIPGTMAVKAVGVAAKAGKYGKGAAKAVGWMAPAAEGASTAAKVGNEVARAAVVGAAADFTLTTPGQQRLSNLALQFDSPWLNNDVTKFLASGEGEGELEARLKGAIEGLVIGIPVDAVVEGVMHGIKAVRHGRVAGEEVARSGGSPEDAMDAAVRAESEYAAQNSESIQRAGQLYESRSGADERADAMADEMMGTASAPGTPGNRTTDIDNGVMDKPLDASPELVRRLDSMAKAAAARPGAGSAAGSDDALASELVRVAKEAWASTNEHESVLSAINEWRISNGFNSTRDLERASRLAYDKYREAQSQLFSGQFKDELASDVQRETDAILAQVSDMVANPANYKIADAVAILGRQDEATEAALAQAGLRKQLYGITFGGSARETLESVVKIADIDPGARALAEWMLKNAAELDDLGTATTKERRKALGVYDYTAHLAKVYDNENVQSAADAVQTTLHETVHGLVLSKINRAIESVVGLERFLDYKNDLGEGAALGGRGQDAAETRAIIAKIKDKDVKRVFEVMDHVLANVPAEWRNKKFGGVYGNNEVQYGLTDVQEFLAEAFTNKKFQEILNGIQMPGAGKSAMMAFAESIARLIGAEELFQKLAKSAGFEGDSASALASVMDAGASIMSRNEMSFGGGSAMVSARPQRSSGLKFSVPDPSRAGRGNPRSSSMPVPNSPRPDPIATMRAQVEDIIRRVRGNPSGWTPTDLQELNRLVEETTMSGLMNTGFGAKNGNTAGEFILAFAEMVSQNKDLYEGIKRVRPNADTAADRDSFLSVMESIGGFSTEQKIRFSQTISDWHGPMFEDGAAVVSAMVGAQMNLYLDAIKRGAGQSEKDALYDALVTMASADRKNANIIGRALQNRKMMWKEELAAKVSQMSPQQVNEHLKFMEGMVKIGLIDKDTWFQVRDSALGTGYMGHALWAFKNSILSGPASTAINFISGSASWLYMPLERSLGYAIDGMFDASQKGRAAKELGVYKQLPTVIGEVWNATRVSFKQAGDSVTLGSGSSPYGEFLGSRGFKPRPGGNVFTTAMDYFAFGAGQAVGLGGIPTKIMGSTDEFFSALSARADMRNYLMHNAPDSVRQNPKRLAVWVRGKMRQAFNDVGALYSEEAVRGQVMREAKARGFEPGSPEWTAYVQNGMAKRWVSPQGADRLDMEFMDRAAAGVRRRTEQTTFKRDYTDILEEAHSLNLGTRTLAGLGRNATGLIRDVPALGFLMPFVKTPTNLLIWAVERSPVEAALNLRKHMDDPEMRGEMIGRLSAGLVMYGVAVTAALNGAITGRGPTDPNVRKALMDSGWQPNSIKVGGRYVSYSRFDPYASILGLMGDAVDIANQRYLAEKEQAEMIDMTAKVVVGSIANNMVNKTYLTGLRNLLDAITNWDAKGQAFIGGLAGGVIPNALTQPYTHFSDEMAAPREIMDRIMARVPGYGGSVDKRRNALGEPMDNPAEGWNLVVPTRTTKESRDPVKRELADLLVGFSAPSPTLDGGIDLTSYRSNTGQTAYDRYQQLTGEIEIGGSRLRDRLAQIVQTSQYRSMPESSVDGVQTTRVNVLRSEIGRYRREALRRLQQEFPDISNRKREIETTKMNMRRGL